MDHRTVIGWLLFAAIIAVIASAAVPRSNWWRERTAKERADVAKAALLESDTAEVATSEEFGLRIAAIVAEHTQLSPRSALIHEIVDLVTVLHSEEDFANATLPTEPTRYDSLEGSRFIEALRAKLQKTGNQEVIEHFAEAIFASLTPILERIPWGNEGGIGFPVLLQSYVQNLPELVQHVMLPFLGRPARDRGLFAKLSQQLERNLYEASGLSFTGRYEAVDKLIFPEKYRGPNPVETYLKGTPLSQLFRVMIDFRIPNENRFEHMHIVAGTGHGKTQTLQRFILHDMQSDAGLVVIDSQGEMLRKVQRLQTDKEIIYVDPADIENPPALNMFDVSRLEGLPAIKREQFLNGLIELLEYVFAGLLKAELTQKQNVLFRYTLRLMLTVPGATIIDLLQCLAEPAPYLAHVSRLNPMARQFMEREFLDRSYTQTREQIRRRLYGVLENPAFRRMFSAKTSSIDVAAALNRGAVVLVDTAKSHLKSDASALMGRYFIALTLQAALEREGHQRPAFLYIDEAGEYFDDNIDTLLNEARKRRVGIVMAHQYLDQLTPQLRSSIATNTAIKMAGGVSDKDARGLSGDMRTTPETIAAQRKGCFVCYVKNVTPSAVVIEVPFGELESLPKRPLMLAQSRLFEDAAGRDEPEAAFADAPEEASLGEPRNETSVSDDGTVNLTPTRDW